jgi:hypothetical protein
MTNSILSNQLATLKRVMEINASDITHEDSLISSPQDGNSVNWITGHMIVIRDFMREAMGLKAAVSKEMKDIYDRGTANVTKENAMKFEDLLKIYYDGTDEMLKQLEAAELTDEEKIKTISTLVFHESYHAGQIGLFRRIMGKEPKIK